MTKNNTSHRIEKWDIAKATLIVFVVLGHFVEYYEDTSVKMRALFLFIYSFHIPCFLFIDGLFCKRNVNEKRYSHIFSYLILYIFIKILMAVSKGIINHSFSFSLFTESSVAWYGLALFWCCLLTIFLKNFPKKWVLIFSILLACFAGYDEDVGNFLVLSRTIVYYPFFFLGYCIDPKELAERLKSLYAKISGAVVLLIFALVCLFATDSIYFVRPLIIGRSAYSALGDFGMETLVNYGALCRLIYYGIVIILCFSFLAIIPTHIKRCPGIATIGSRTLYIYILHQPLIYILYHGFNFIALSTAAGISNLIIVPMALLLTMFLSLPFWGKILDPIIYPWKLSENG